MDWKNNNLNRSVVLQILHTLQCFKYKWVFCYFFIVNKTRVFFHFVRWDWKDAHYCDTKLNKLCKFCDQIHCKNVFTIIPMQFKFQLCMKNGIASKIKFMLDGSFTNIIKYLVTTIYYSAMYLRLILSQWEICSVCVWLKIM